MKDYYKINEISKLYGIGVDPCAITSVWAS